MLKRVLVLSLALSAACASKESPGSTPGAGAAPRARGPRRWLKRRSKLLHAGTAINAWWGHDELMPVSKKPRDW